MTGHDITAAVFLDTIFADIDPDTETVCVAKMFKADDGVGWWNVADDDNVFTKWRPEKQHQAWYFCVSSVGGEKNEKGTALRRRAKDVIRYHCLVLDDIGTKASPPPVEPTWKIESSIDNFQWGYALKPSKNFKEYEALIEFCHEQGWGDAGAGGCYRVMRVPGSANLKKGRKNFHSIVTDWHPDRYWSLSQLALALGCTDLKERAARQKGNKRTLSNQTTTSAPEAIDNIDPLYDWLLAHNHVVKDDGGDFIDIRCPWSDQHTTGSDTAGYSPLGRGDGDWVQSRGFKCLHEHCNGRHFKDLMDVLAEDGAPRVSGVDPLPWLQHRYTYIGFGARVADLEQRPHGGDWLWDFEDWAKMHKGRVLVPGRDAPVEMKTAFLEHKKTRKAINTQYWPVKADEDIAIIRQENQDRINIYVPPNHPHTTTDPAIFLDHIDFLLPDDKERDIFLDWLAFKIQNPATRSYAVIMIAEDGFGVGRSWLKAMMKKVLQGKVRTATLPQLIGKGTSSEQNYNDWAAYCQLLVVEEAKDNMSKEDFYNGYETFKQNVDTRVSDVRVNPKYGKTKEEYMFFNALIFSNHSDALSIPKNDRRCCVLTNPTVMADVTYYDRLEGALSGTEPGEVYWYLMERDIAAYDNVYPPQTIGKTLMTDQNAMPSAEIKAHILDACNGDVITKKMLKSRVISAAHALDYEGISHAPGGIIRNLWGKMGKLRDEAKGARYYINGEQVEVRAIRNKERWVSYDMDRDKNTIEEELLKNDKTGGAGLKLVK